MGQALAVIVHPERQTVEVKIRALDQVKWHDDLCMD